MPTHQSYDLDVIVPVKNEADDIPILYDRLEAALSSAKISYQLIFAYDDETDPSVPAIKKLSKIHPHIIRVLNTKPGKAFALLTAIKASNSNYIAMIDADLQYPPEAIPEMFVKARESGICVATRSHFEHNFVRKVTSRLNHLLINRLILGLHCDVQSGLKVFKRKIAESIDDSHMAAWTFDIPLLLESQFLGHSISSVSINFSERHHGHSKVKFIKTTGDIISTAFQYKFSKGHFRHFIF